MDEILEGWKEIGYYWGFRGVSVDTIRRKARRLKMPFLRTGDTERGKPWITKSALDTWWQKMQEKAVNSHQIA
ncbi:MAG TPA: hypothetical protein VGB21_02530 [Candidatus Methylomirabilis sp.]